MIITEEMVVRAAYAMLKTDPVPMGMFEFDEACDLARAALEAAINDLVPHPGAIREKQS